MSNGAVTFTFGVDSTDASMDAGNLLKPVSARVTLRIIGAMTANAYRKYF